MTLNQKKFEEWKSSCEQIRRDLSHLLNNKQIYDYFSKVICENSDYIRENGGMPFYEFVRNCYGYQSAVGIRRHVKSSDKHSISLMKLLEELTKHAEEFTVNFYLECYSNENRENLRILHEMFNNFSDDGNTLSSCKIKNDIEKINSISKDVCDLVDRRIAHLDKRGIIKNATLRTTNDSLDSLDKIARKYIMLITGSNIISGRAKSLKPILPPNWKKIFTVPFDKSYGT